MRDRTVRRMAVTAALAIAMVTTSLPLRARAAQEPDRGEAQHSSSQSDQTDLSVTVYNSDLALVRDVRNLTLPSGTFRLNFQDIAASVDPATVHFRSLSDPGRVSVLEQNYEYDLLDPAKLLAKYVGHEVTLVRARQVNGTTEYENVPATLLADNNGPVWKIGNEIVTGFPAQTLRFPELPENLYDRPTLVWTLANRGPAKQKVEASYLAHRLSWSADYVLTVNREDTAADMDGWVTLVNNSGTAFRNARLQLVAGELNRVRPAEAYRALKAIGGNQAAAPPPFVQEAFSEYHLYTLERRTTIENNENKQISLLGASGVPVQKAYQVNGRAYYYRSALRPGAPMRDPVEVYYRFRNDAASRLGMPLPAGTVRIYQSDSRGNMLFAGEDRIAHTPKDEDVSLHIGNAFDVVAERRQTDFHELSGRLYEMEYEITLRNHKAVPVTVEVNEPIGGDWQILSSSFPWKKTAAFAAQFIVPVAAGGSAVLRYRVRVRW